MILFGKDHVITTEDINNTIENEQEFNPVEFVDLILSQNTIKAIKMFDLLKSGEDYNIILIVRSFLFNIDNLLKMKQAIENNITTIEEATKFVFWKRKAIVQQILKNLTTKHFEFYIKKLYEIEKDAKKYGNDIATRLFEKNIILKKI